MDGSTISEVHYLTREDPPRLLTTVSSPRCPWPTGGQGRRCLSPEAALTLAKWGLALEKAAGGPQDLEWCQDQEGALYLLQTRPLQSGPVAAMESQEPGEIPESSHPVLARRGYCQSRPGDGPGTCGTP